MTFHSRLLGRRIDVEEFEQVVREYFASQAQTGPSVVINLDGKMLRGTIPAGQTRELHLLAVFLPGEGWGMVQLEVDRRENEI